MARILRTARREDEAEERRGATHRPEVLLGSRGHGFDQGSLEDRTKEKALARTVHGSEAA